MTGVQRVDQLAINIELQLLVRRIADPHRAAVVIAGQPRDLTFGQPALAGEAVHDLHLRGVPRRRAQQPFAPGARLAAIAGAEQRVERQRRVADPAEAVIPVARPARAIPATRSSPPRRSRRSAGRSASSA